MIDLDVKRKELVLYKISFWIFVFLLLVSVLCWGFFGDSFSFYLAIGLSFLGVIFASYSVDVAERDIKSCSVVRYWDEEVKERKDELEVYGVFGFEVKD